MHIKCKETCKKWIKVGDKKLYSAFPQKIGERTLVDVNVSFIKVRGPAVKSIFKNQNETCLVMMIVRENIIICITIVQVIYDILMKQLTIMLKKEI